MASADVISGGNIEPRALEDEMKTAYPVRPGAEGHMIPLSVNWFVLVPAGN